MRIPETRSFASAYGPSVTAFADPRTTFPPLSSGPGPISAWPAFTRPPTHSVHLARWAPISAGGGGGCRPDSTPSKQEHELGHGVPLLPKLNARATPAPDTAESETTTKAASPC